MNALAEQACSGLALVGRTSGPGRAIGAAAIEDTNDALILDRVTDLDPLADKLQEERVRRVIEPVLAGIETHEYSIHDLDHVRDLGLVARNDRMRIANPVYAEVVPHKLPHPLQSGLRQDP